MASASRVGTMIKLRRQELGLKQEQLADLVGVHVSSVTNWENGKHFPGRHQGKLEAVLGIRLDGSEPGEEVYTDPAEAAIWAMDKYSPDERRKAISTLRQKRRAG